VDFLLKNAEPCKGHFYIHNNGFGPCFSTVCNPCNSVTSGGGRGVNFKCIGQPSDLIFRTWESNHQDRKKVEDFDEKHIS